MNTLYNFSKWIFTIFCLSISLPDNITYAQEFVWAKQIGSQANDDKPKSITTDQSGNVYITGTFIGIVDFDPGPGIYNLTSVSSSTFDIFISKLDPAGNFLWAKRIGASTEEEGLGIEVDQSGHVYVCGYFQLTVDFDPGPGIYNLTSTGSSDIFILKLDTNGNFIWVKQIGGSGSKGASDIVLDATANIYTTGTITFSDSVDFDPGPAVYKLKSGSFVCKMDSSGNFIWAKQLGGIGQSISLDKSGNVYSMGSFNAPADFNPGDDTFMLSPKGNRALYISKLSNLGHFIWAKQISGSGAIDAKSMETTNDGFVYVTGDFNNRCDFDPGSDSLMLTSWGEEDIFIAKLNPNGGFEWAKQMGSNKYEEVMSLDLDAEGNVYTTGIFRFGDFDPGVAVYNLSTTGISDVFISKLNASGEFVWAQNIGGAKGTKYGMNFASDIKVISVDEIIVTGYFNGTTDFNPGQESYNLTSFNFYDVFLFHLAPAITNTTSEISESVIHYFPNPASSVLHIKLHEYTEPVELMFNDILGNTVRTVTIYPGISNIELEGMSAGAYLLTIKQNIDQNPYKLLIQN